MKDKVSIIVVSYDNIECLRRATSDILVKTTYPFELIVVDNHSTDPMVRDYLEYLDRLDQVRVVHTDSNIYYFPAVNVGIQEVNPNHRYTLVLNDDVVIQSDQWIQRMIEAVESDENIAYVGDLMTRSDCPPFGGWVDGWCMLFKTRMLAEVGLFNEEYVWWYAPADYAIRTYKQGYRIADLKRVGDKCGQIAGIITHLEHQTLDRVREREGIPEDAFFQPDFKYDRLLLQHGLLRCYAVLRIRRLARAVAAQLSQILKRLTLL